MQFNRTTFFFLVLCISTLTFVQAQCNLVETIVICDMTQIDNDNDGSPDGIINLYDEYTNLTGNTIQAGTWFDPGFNFALNEATGDLFLWDLNESSTTTTDYQFELTNANCGSDVALTINLVLGPFSGIALPTNLEDVNVQVCDAGSTPIDVCVALPDMDLFEALESLPSPHANGEWIYEGSSPNFNNISGSQLFVTVPYAPGPPLVDEETFELVYRVEGIAPCDLIQETRVKISVVRQVFSGLAQNQRICETSILNGDFDNDIDLTDDQFLIFEDIEGTWEMDMFGQVTSLGDSEVNINSIYQQIIANNVRFGCVDVGFTYSVEQRSGVCEDTSTTISFKLYESLRPFSQSNFPEFCENDPSIPTTINLYDQLTFTTENGVLFDYPSDACTQWSLLSGPSNLGLVSNGGGCTPTPGYSHLGSVSLAGAEPGTYVFQYTVSPEVNCNPDNFSALDYLDACTSVADTSGFCNAETAEVVIVIYPKNYAGEDTMGIEFCESDITGPIDLISLLQTNGIDDPIYQGPLGTWTDLDTGGTIANPFTLPAFTGQQTFNFIYNTTTANNCLDSATLTFTVFEEYSSGVGSTLDVCNDESAFNLFDVLTDNPSTTGTWSGPNDFVSTDNNVIFDPATSTAGEYIYTVPDNGLCMGGETSVTITVLSNANAGSDMMATLCQSDLQIDLLNLLDPQADLGGIFVDLDSTSALNGSILDVTSLNEGSYDFEYQVQGNTLCDPDSALITIEVLDIVSPNVEDQTFCLIDGATIADLIVTSNDAQSFNWYDDASSTTILPASTLLVNNEDYFVTAIDDNGCESDRVSMVVTLLPLNDDTCDDCEINDGISDNGDGDNDVLDLCNLPVVFPNFELEIFNRYGTIVFKGNRNTELFHGESNVSLTLGDRLPSGVYFYVFNPNDSAAEPFQGHFYLSR